MLESDPRTWVIEHMTPRAQGGADDLTNLALACDACNKAKGNRTVEQFRGTLKQSVVGSMTGILELQGLCLDGESGILTRMVILAEAMKIEFAGELKRPLTFKTLQVIEEQEHGQGRSHEESP